MSDYISRDVAIIEFMDNDIDHIQAPNGKEAIQILSDIPSADVVPVIHARWVYNIIIFIIIMVIINSSSYKNIKKGVR